MCGIIHITHFECVVIASGYRSLNLLLFNTWVSVITLNLSFGVSFGWVFLYFMVGFWFVFKRMTLCG